MIYSSLEVDSRRLERIFGRECKKELKFPALKRIRSLKPNDIEDQRVVYSIGRTLRAIHNNIPVEQVGFVDQADSNTRGWFCGDLCQLLYAHEYICIKTLYVDGGLLWQFAFDRQT